MPPPRCFSERADCRYSKARLQNFPRKYSESWLLRAIIKSYILRIWPKVEPIQRLSYWRQPRKLHVFPHTSPDGHADFKKRRNWGFAHVRVLSICPPITRATIGITLFLLKVSLTDGLLHLGATQCFPNLWWSIDNFRIPFFSATYE